MKIAEIEVAYKAASKRDKITKSSEAFELVLNDWNKNTLELQEEFKVLLLNNANFVLGIYPFSKGGISGTAVDIRKMMSVLLKSLATGFIILHNHPSGNLKPSESDIDLTKKIKKASELLDIRLLDHLIITANGYFSFCDENLI